MFREFLPWKEFSVSAKLVVVVAHAPMSLEKSRGRRGTVNFVRSARAFDESAGPPHVRLLAASLGVHDLIRF